MSKRISKDDLLEKIVADYTRRVRKGKAPKISAYQDKYPEFSDEIDDLLASVAMIEGLKNETVDQDKSSHDHELSSLKQLGDYLLIREIGRGGMGIVFEAVHQSLGRRVAIKVMRRRDIEDEKYITRFRREARSAAKLHHTNIVSVFGVGESNGYHYYVMEFIDGASLNHVVRSITRRLSVTIEIADTFSTTQNDAATRIDNHSDTTPSNLNSSNHSSARTHSSFESKRIPKGVRRFKWVAEIGAQISDALAHAHSQGILHRDVKPANLLLDQNDNVWITDFGLVKENDLEGLTKTGDVIGTPQYMAPESFRGIYDQRSEVHCLGLTLYELSTLQPAFADGTTAEVIHRVTATTPLSPRKIDPKIPKDLNTIIEKSIARDPNQRYKTALELRDDLRAFVEGRTISARKPSTLEQAWRWGRRNPLPATLTILSTFLLCAFAAASTIGMISTNRAYAKLEDEIEQTKAARNAAIENQKVAIANEKKTQIQFERAESNVALIVKAFDEMFKQVVSPGENSNFEFDGFRELGGIETAVNVEDAKFLKKMMEFYEQFAQQNSENKNLLFESARAFRRIANINYLIGETNAAVDAYQKALQFYEPMLEESPDSVECLLNVVNTRAELSAAQRRRGEFTFRQARLNVATIKAHSQLNHPQVQLALAQNLAIEGSAFVEQITMESASELMEVIDSENAPDRPEPNRRGDRSRPKNGQETNMGQRFRDAFDQRFIRNTLRAIEIGEKLLLHDQQNPQYLSLLGKTYSSLAALQLRTKDPNANETLKKAKEQFSQLRKEYPENLKYQYQLAVTYLLDPTDKVDAGTKRQIAQTIEIANELVEKSPNPEYKQLQILAHVKMAAHELAGNHLSEAVNQQKSATNYLNELNQQVEGGRSFRHIKHRLARNYDIIVRAYRKQGDNPEADRIHDITRDLMRRAGFPPPFRDRHDRSGDGRRRGDDRRDGPPRKGGRPR